MSPTDMILARIPTVTWQREKYAIKQVILQFYTSLTKIIKVNHSVHLHCIFFNKNWIKLKLSSQLSASHIHFKLFTLCRWSVSIAWVCSYFFIFSLGSHVYILAFTLNILIYQLNDQRQYCQLQILHRISQYEISRTTHEVYDFSSM